MVRNAAEVDARLSTAEHMHQEIGEVLVYPGGVDS